MNLKNKIVSIGSLRSCDPGTEKQHSETTRCRETGTFQGLRCYPPWNWRETLGLEDAFPFWKGLFFRGKIAVSGRVTIGKKWTGFLQAEEAKLERRELQEQETRHEVRPPVIQPGSGGGCLFGILLFIPFFYYKTNKNQMKHMKEWVLCIYYVLGIHGFNSCDFPCPGVCFLGGSGRREGKRSKKNWMKFRRDARSLRKLCPNAFHCCCCCPMIRCEESGAHVTCMFFFGINVTCITVFFGMAPTSNVGGWWLLIHISMNSWTMPCGRGSGAMTRFHLAPWTGKERWTENMFSAVVCRPSKLIFL